LFCFVCFCFVLCCLLVKAIPWASIVLLVERPFQRYVQRLVVSCCVVLCCVVSCRVACCLLLAVVGCVR
jgi:hypothetical protein